MTPLSEQPKTRQQEESYHVLFEQIANHCVAHGIDLKMAMDVIKRYEVAVTKEFVKSTWRSILKAKTGKERTRDQTKEDIKQVQPEFEKLWGEITGETFDWPSINALLLANSDDPKYY